MKATEVTTCLAESNGSLLLGLWRDSLHVTCGLTACTPGSAPGPTLGNEYRENFTFTFCTAKAAVQQLLFVFFSGNVNNLKYMNKNIENDIFGFPKVKWLHLTSEGDKSVSYSCRISRDLTYQKLLKSVKGGPFFDAW